jgi:hypothetical protein
MNFITEKDFNSYPAVKVMYAVHSVFAEVGNEDYAKSKTNNFLRRCGVDINKLKEQPIDVKRIKEVVYAMLDADTEKTFWLRLDQI